MPRLTAKELLIVLLVAAPFAVPLLLSVEGPEGAMAAPAGPSAD